MSVSYAQAKEQIAKLVERFACNLDVYKRPEYKEARVRVEFVDPFFEALGWDVRNVRGHAEQYKDVVHEDAIKISGATRAPALLSRKVSPFEGQNGTPADDRRPSLRMCGAAPGRAAHTSTGTQTAAVVQ